MSEGFVSEIFSGIQGEGLLVGERQVFIRLAGCNLKCAYCDTPSSQTPTDSCRIEQTAGKRDFLTRSNPVTAEDVADYASRLQMGTGAVVFTGGEPLVQHAFLVDAVSLLTGRRIMLETNGSLPDALPEILPHIDIVSMDIKLPSATCGPDLLQAHEQFLLKAITRDVSVKIVLTADTSTDELLAAVGIIKSVDAKIPLVLQPVTGDHPPSPSQVLDWQAQCLMHLSTVLVIPQCHKMMGQL
ncbi:MAG TPA: 7-carboxy-7-deazaguanine synthase QueE [Armatimonadota bacterium]|nr:7-carboxy-7-deazaguanine synthase QueE [Armatimonadota bacterium]